MPSFQFMDRIACFYRKLSNIEILRNGGLPVSRNMLSAAHCERYDVGCVKEWDRRLKWRRR